MDNEIIYIQQFFFLRTKATKVIHRRELSIIIIFERRYLLENSIYCWSFLEYPFCILIPNLQYEISFPARDTFLVLCSFQPRHTINQPIRNDIVKWTSYSGLNIRWTYSFAPCNWKIICTTDLLTSQCHKIQTITTIWTGTLIYWALKDIKILAIVFCFT